MDGAFEALPLDEWYNFTPVAKYKSLNAEVCIVVYQPYAITIFWPILICRVQKVAMNLIRIMFHVINALFLVYQEAEEEFTRRDKTLNYFTIMMKKRLNKEEELAEGGEDPDEKKSKSSKKKKNKVNWF